MADIKKRNQAYILDIENMITDKKKLMEWVL